MCLRSRSAVVRFSSAAGRQVRVACICAKATRKLSWSGQGPAYASRQRVRCRSRGPIGMRSLARQQQVSELYHAALLLEPPARTPFLQLHCGSDDGLRAEVSSLLGYDSAAADFLEHSPIAANPSRPAASIGSRIGPYQVVAHLGAGGMGEVYRARDARLGRDVALKMLPTNLATVADRQRRLDREARTLAGLNHPHIAAIYGVEESAGNRALVLELVEGQTLHQRIHGSVGETVGTGPDARPGARTRRGPVPVRE